MGYTKIVNKLLYVPFNQYYTVADSIMEKMTMCEFFRNVFYFPDFSDEIERLSAANEDELENYDSSIPKIEIIRQLNDSQRYLTSYEYWLNNDINEVYCLIGSSGCGKTTFLHYNKYMKPEYNWNILDIQTARNGVSVNGRHFHASGHSLLFDKVWSSVIQLLADNLFVYADGSLDCSVTADSIVRTKKEYVNKVSQRTALDVRSHDFFAKIPEINGEDIGAYCDKCSNYFIDYFRNLSTNGNYLSITIEILLILLYLLSDIKKNIIVFDNLERFIGTDEIYNSEICEFVQYIRNFIGEFSVKYQKTGLNKTLFSKHYQFILSIRRTSLRMIQTQQTSDYDERKLDISTWFPINKVIGKKIEWYDKNGFDVFREDLIRSVITDEGFSEKGILGIQMKLDMLFNFNKRLIVEFLTIVLNREYNYVMLERANKFWKNDYGIKPMLSKFAARSIIMRLILDELQLSDDLFKKILALRGDEYTSHTSYDEPQTGIGDARKILTILNNFNFQTVKGLFVPFDLKYMPLPEMVRVLYSGDKRIRNIKNIFINKGSADERIKIAKILYYMNYCNRRDNNWLQFIDVQYKCDSMKKISIASYDDLDKLMQNHYTDISIRITNGGRAFLAFFVHSFEYFSCRYNAFSLPLLCTIPSKNEIENKNIQDLECVKTIMCVETQVKKCIEQMDSCVNNKTILYRKTAQDIGQTHKQRILQSHKGYISNFLDCLNRIFENEKLSDNGVAALQELRGWLLLKIKNYAKEST